MAQDNKPLTDREKAILRELEAEESNELWRLLRVELEARHEALQHRILAKKEHYNGLKDRDMIAELRTIEEVINLPKTLASPLKKRYYTRKE